MLRLMVLEGLVGTFESHMHVKSAYPFPYIKMREVQDMFIVAALRQSMVLKHQSQYEV